MNFSCITILSNCPYSCLNISNILDLEFLIYYTPSLHGIHLENIGVCVIFHVELHFQLHHTSSRKCYLQCMVEGFDYKCEVEEGFCPSSLSKTSHGGHTVTCHQQPRPGGPAPWPAASPASAQAREVMKLRHVTSVGKFKCCSLQLVLVQQLNLRL